MIMEGVLAGALKAFFKHALVQHKISFDEINAEPVIYHWKYKMDEFSQNDITGLMIYPVLNFLHCPRRHYRLSPLLLLDTYLSARADLCP